MDSLLCNGPALSPYFGTRAICGASCPDPPTPRRRSLPADRVRPYLFYDTAISICSTCYRRAEGKIVFEDGKVYLLKRCPIHGPERVLMADDVAYYRLCR